MRTLIHRNDGHGANRDTRRGSVVLFVLGIILLAAFLITRLMDRASVELAAESKAAKRADLRQEALSALETSLAVLADEAAVRAGLHDVSEGWGRPLALAEYQPGQGYVVEAVVEDETGKLSLPATSEEDLRDYLTTIGCPVTALDRLVDGLLVWTRPDYLSVDGEADDATHAAALPYEAPGRALRSFAELRAISATRELFFDEHGEWNELGRRFRDGASLFAFNASNVNSAPADVLLARGLDAAQVAAIIAAREQKNSRRATFRTAAELAGAWGRDAAPPGLGTDALCLHVVVIAKFGAREYRLDAWVQPAGMATTATGRRQTGAATAAKTATPPASVRNNPRKSMDYPFRILELRENDGT